MKQNVRILNLIKKIINKKNSYIESLKLKKNDKLSALESKKNDLVNKIKVT